MIKPYKDEIREGNKDWSKKLNKIRKLALPTISFTLAKISIGLEKVGKDSGDEDYNYSYKFSPINTHILRIYLTRNDYGKFSCIVNANERRKSKYKSLVDVACNLDNVYECYEYLKEKHKYDYNIDMNLLFSESDLSTPIKSLLGSLEQYNLYKENFEDTITYRRLKPHIKNNLLMSKIEADKIMYWFSKEICTVAINNWHKEALELSDAWNTSIISKYLNIKKYLFNTF